MKSLKELIVENPELELVFFVAEGVNNGDYHYMKAESVGCSIDSYTLDPYNDEMMILKSDGYDGFADYYCEMDGRFDSTDDEIDKAYQSLDWTKAIVVYLDEQ
jgi:hypothetical protein